jgi:hypothetical protein
MPPLRTHRSLQRFDGHCADAEPGPLVSALSEFTIGAPSGEMPARIVLNEPAQ